MNYQRKGLIAALVILTSCTALAQSGGVTSRLERAAALIRDNQLAEAERQLTKILRVTPNEPLALNLLGTIRAQQRRLNEAEVLFVRAIRLNNQLVGAHVNLAHLFSLKNQPEKEISELKEVVRLDPKSPGATERLIKLLTARGRLDEIINTLEQVKLARSLPTPLLLLLGDAYLKTGKADQAEESYRLLLQEEPANTDAVLGLAQAHQLRGNAENALAYLRQARKMAAPAPETLYRFALVSIDAGLYEDANKALLAAIELRSDQPAYFLALGTTWIKKPDFLEAEQAFRRALQLEPENARGQMYLGYALLEQKKYGDARAWLEKSLGKDQSIPETYYYLGLIAQEENEDERAITLFKKTLNLLPSYSFGHTALGASYLRQKNYALARQELELSIKLNPNDSRAHYNLAVLYARLKEPERAQQEMQIVEQLKSAGKQKLMKGETNVPPAKPRPK